MDAGFKKDELGNFKIFGPVGCDHCVKGYKGRVGIYQVMPISEAMTQIIFEGGDANKLAKQARDDGVDDLRESGLNKIRAGITSLEEIDRVTKD